MSHPERRAWLRRLESAAPFVAGALLLTCGMLAAAQACGWDAASVPPLGPLPLSAALLLAGAGAAVLFASWDARKHRLAALDARNLAARAHAQLDLALRQARRLRAQADGLALMREIHRSSAIPERFDRLRRILAHVADLFEAREVMLLAARERDTSHAGGGARPGTEVRARAAAPAPPPEPASEPLTVLPAACLWTGLQDEVFAAFESEGLERWLLPSGRRSAGRPQVRDGVLTSVGEWLYAEGQLTAGGVKLARVQGRQPLAGDPEAATRLQAEPILTALLARLDFSAQACREAGRALAERRTLRLRESPAAEAPGAEEETLVLCVPLLADQRPVGVLRIRRPAEGFDGPAAEALEEMLLESAKHIALAMKKDQDDLKAITDQLTGFFIKRHLLDTLERLQALAAEEGAGFACILADLDHFKAVNDTHGHLTGDLVLREVARVLRSGLRAGDLPFRYGGEELVILMPGATARAAEQLAERLRAAVEATPFKGEQDQTVAVTLSLGVAAYRTPLTGEQLLARADRALYHSKHAGRNRVTAWRPGLAETEHVGLEVKTAGERGTGSEG